ncbi:MAG TPA: FAD-dependent oxidoreductase [Candidatus Polarisedimenticolaceae bacterium]|nr:FAD-dependent oxidoreductase [Candidatus Polarisedimenticolaceae bacterium]
MNTGRRIIVVGGGVFGLTAAVELCRRGWRVRLFDSQHPPAARASSSDISKAVRADYGDDTFYGELASLALERWRDWNAASGVELYHEVGFLLLTPRPMEDGGFEYESFRRLRQAGQSPERIDAGVLARRFPAWAGSPYVDGYYNPHAGWSPSARVVEWLAARATAEGVAIEVGAVDELVVRASRVLGVRTRDGDVHRADRVLVAAGAWTPRLVPAAERELRAIGQPVLLLKPADPSLFEAARFPVWAADIANTGWYGFPATEAGIVKLANHGPGRPVLPDEPLEVRADEIERFRAFLGASCPALADAPAAGSRLCLYCDTPDGDFWIDHDPTTEGLVVAAGGSGHGFKFAPVLGPIVADVVECRPNRWAARFGWRQPDTGRKEHARSRKE